MIIRRAWLLCTLLLCGCGGAQVTGVPRWSTGEQLRWARFNPCACLASDRLITSVELRPLNAEAPSTYPPPLGLWERVVIERPLSPEAGALIATLKAQGEAPQVLLVDVDARLVSIESHTFRVARLIGAEPAEVSPPDEEPPAAALPEAP